MSILAPFWLLVACKTSISASAPMAEAAMDPAYACVDALIAHLKIELPMRTDPAVMRSILRDDMLLADLPALQAPLQASLAAPVDVGPIVQQIRHAIVNKHAAVNEFLCQATKLGLLPPVGDAERATITRALHHIVLFDQIVASMASDWHTMIAVQDHLLAKRQALGVRGDFLGSTIDIGMATKSVFLPVKLKTMDWVFSGYRTMREQDSPVIHPGFDVQERQLKLVLNILEATVDDRSKGYKDNAMAGAALAINPFPAYNYREADRFLEYDFQQQWVSLYETWNLAFITGELDNLQLFYPKLLIPHVIDAKPEEYLFYRALALWPSLNFDLFATLRHTQATILPRRQELAKKWGEINRVYAKELVKNLNHKDVDSMRAILAIPAQSWLQKQIDRLRGTLDDGAPK